MMCAELIEGCPDCDLEAVYLESVGHDCGQLSSKWSRVCDVFGEARRKSESFHRLSHEPDRCGNCRGVLSDRLGHVRYTSRVCRSGLCTLIVCPDCGATDMSWGAIGCPSCSGLQKYPVNVSRMHAAYRHKKTVW